MKSDLLQHIRTLTLDANSAKVIVTSASLLELADKDIEEFRTSIVSNGMNIGKARASILQDLNLDDGFVMVYLYVLHFRVSTSVTWVEMERTRALVVDLYLSSLTINQF